MVTEFAQYGSLQDLMNKRPDGNEVSYKMRMKIILDAAKAQTLASSSAS